MFEGFRQASADVCNVLSNGSPHLNTSLELNAEPQAAYRASRKNQSLAVSASDSDAAHLGRILLWQRSQVLLHSNPAPFPLNPIELLRGSGICTGVGAAGALYHVLVRKESVSTAISHAPATKITLAEALHSKATRNDESDANKNTLNVTYSVKSNTACSQPCRGHLRVRMCSQM